MKTTPNGKNCCSFRLAVERNFKNGEERKTDFINFVAWNQTADFIVKRFKKGSVFGVEGWLRPYEYADKEGTKHYTYEIVVDNVFFTESKKD